MAMGHMAAVGLPGVWDSMFRSVGLWRLADLSLQVLRLIGAQSRIPRRSAHCWRCSRCWRVPGALGPDQFKCAIVMFGRRARLIEYK